MNLSYSSKRKIGVFLSYIQLAISTTFSLLLVPILLKSLGQSQYGIYQLVISIGTYFSFISVVLSTATIRFYSSYKSKNDKESMNKVLLLSRKLFFVFSLIILFIGFILFFLINPFYKNSFTLDEILMFKRLYIIVVIYIFIEINTYVYAAFLTSNEEFVFLRIVSILHAIIQPLLIILFVNKYPYIYILGVIHLTLSLIIYILHKQYSTRFFKLTIEKVKIDKDLVKQITNFSLVIVLVVIADQIFWRTDQIIISKISGPIFVAIYMISSIIYSNFIKISSAITNVFLPYLSQLEEKQEIKKVNDLFVRVGRIQFFILSFAFSGFILFGQEFLLIWLGKGYEIVYFITIIIISVFIPDLCQSLGLTILQIRNHYKFRGFVYFFISILNIFLTIILINHLSLIGVALATAISLFIGNIIIMNYYYVKYEKLSVLKLWKEIIKISLMYIIIIPIGLLIKNTVDLNNIYIEFLVWISTYAFIFIVLSTLWMNTSERELLFSPIKKIMKRNH